MGCLGQSSQFSVASCLDCSVPVMVRMDSSGCEVTNGVVLMGNSRREAAAVRSLAAAVVFAPLFLLRFGFGLTPFIPNLAIPSPFLRNGLLVIGGPTL